MKPERMLSLEGKDNLLTRLRQCLEEVEVLYIKLSRLIEVYQSQKKT